LSGERDVVIVFDCGSSKLRIAALDEACRIVAQESAPNSPKPQPGGEPTWRIWDLEEIWGKLCILTRRLMKSIEGRFNPIATTIATWGADGVPIKRDGTTTYYAISWMCPRTSRIAEEVSKRMDPWEIFRITGYQIIVFNTLHRLIWLRRHAPSALEEAYTWLMMPGYFSYKLTGALHIDPTSGSTMMAMDLGKRDWSEEMLALAGLDPSFFPEWREPGEVLGEVTEEAARQTGLPRGLPVVVGGHDTQFAILAANPAADQAALSSGTWEILALRLNRYDPSREAYELGVVIEADVEPGFWNPQFLMPASLVLEWVRRLMYREEVENVYEVMVGEAERVPAGAGGLILLPSFMPDTGPTKAYGIPGVILGLTPFVERGHIYRAALEGLSYQLRLAIEGLEKAFGVKLSGVKVVGGGSKNRLWNKIRADVTGRLIVTSRIREATVAGAALTAFKGAGRFRSFKEALASMEAGLESHAPGESSGKYDELYKVYLELYPVLAGALKRVKGGRR